MAIFSDLELMGIMNESKNKEDDSILDSIEDRIKTNTGQVKDGIEKAKDNVKKNSWIGKKKAAKNESTNTITFREDSEGNITGCALGNESIEEGKHEHHFELKIGDGPKNKKRKSCWS